MKINPFYKKLIVKIDHAWIENEKKLDEERDALSREFLYGYRLALNEISAWIEVDSSI